MPTSFNFVKYIAICLYRNFSYEKFGQDRTVLSPFCTTKFSLRHFMCHSYFCEHILSVYSSDLTHVNVHTFVFAAVFIRFCVFSLPTFLNFARFSVLKGTPRVERCCLTGRSRDTWFSKARCRSSCNSSA